MDWQSMLRRTRAIVTTSLLWSVTWALAGIPIGLLDWLFFIPDWYRTLESIPNMIAGAVILLGISGALCGLGFAALVSRSERGRTIDALATRRIAGVGALAGAVMPVAGMLLFTLAIGATEDNSPILLLSVAAVGSLLGAGSSSASLRLARTVDIPVERQIASS